MVNNIIQECSLSRMRRAWTILQHHYNVQRFRSGKTHSRERSQPGLQSNISICPKFPHCAHAKTLHVPMMHPSLSHTISSYTYPPPFLPMSCARPSYENMNSNYVKHRHSRLWRTFDKHFAFAPTCTNTKTGRSQVRVRTLGVKISSNAFTKGWMLLR